MSVFGEYISNIEQDLRGGKATEYTYRSALEIFMESLAHGIQASNDPKHIECGAPDFIIEKGKVPLGYVETKDVGADLDKIEKSDQMKRYLKALGNLILTDYLEFRWYVNGEKKRVARVASVVGGKLRVEENGEMNLTQLFHDFYATETPTVNTPKELAGRLASVTHFIRDQIINAMNSGEERIQKGLSERYNVFRELLLPALTADEFSDLYAQAMTYGLFAAKLSAPAGENFTLAGAYQFLFGNKFLRRLFSDVSEELDEIEIIRPYLLDIVSLLNRANFANILADFGRRTKTEDPVVHFYETFLAAYDSKLRESRGVFYTPEPAVQFIVNGIHHLLKTRFNLSWGLADSAVKVLDPATGTGTFLFYVILKIYEEIVTTRKQAGQWKQKSKDLLSRVFGFELLIAPYVVSHLKLSLLLKELDAPLEGKDERLHVYLTNTLDEGVTRAEQLAGLGHYIAEESSDAAFVKKNQEIVVVVGNPPYSGHSANASVDKNGVPNFIGKLLREYYFVDGAPLGERNPKWLQDDYVKFIRFGEWRINKTGHGVLAFVTNHGYLDNPTFRGMRQHLMQTFDEIYVLDLHGNSKKKEKTPDGGKDENIFDIQQGVAIIFAIKNPVGMGLAPIPATAKDAATKKGRPQGSPQPSPLRIYHASLWGLREEKYATLRDSGLDDIEWTELNPDKPFYLFVPQDKDIAVEYQQGLSLVDIFPKNTVGVVTGQDQETIGFSFDETRRLAEKHKISSKQIVPISYRPFDNRFIVYDKKVVTRPRLDVMPNMISGENLGLISARSNKSDEMNHFFVSTTISETKCGESTTQSFISPLYLYTTPEETAGTLFAQSEVTRQANLAPEFIKAVEERLKVTVTSEVTVTSKQVTPEDIFYYAYAVFHSPTYRQRYAEFLKIDFPRLPITGDKKLFRKLAKLGQELVELHLLKSSKVDEFVTSYPEAGNNQVEFVKPVSRPDRSHQKSVKQDSVTEQDAGKSKLRGDLSGLVNVFINETQYFGKVPQEVWEFKVGGYQVCEKWLKDRKGRILSGEDITHYQRVIVALKETIKLMKEIDKTVKFPME